MGLDAEAESDATTATGIATVGVAVADDITETIAVARTRRTLPPVVSGATSVLHLRIARLVISVLRSFAGDGVGVQKSRKIRRGLSVMDSPRGLFIEEERCKSSALRLHRRRIPSAPLSHRFVFARSSHPYRESFLP